MTRKCPHPPPPTTCLAANATAPGTLRSQVALLNAGPLLILVHGNQTAVGPFTLAVTCN